MRTDNPIHIDSIRFQIIHMRTALNLFNIYKNKYDHKLTKNIQKYCFKNLWANELWEDEL